MMMMTGTWRFRFDVGPAFHSFFIYLLAHQTTALRITAPKMDRPMKWSTQQHSKVRTYNRHDEWFVIDRCRNVILPVLLQNECGLLLCFCLRKFCGTNLRREVY